MRRLRILSVQVGLGLVLFEICLQLYNPLPFRVRGDRITLPVHASYVFHNTGPRLDPIVRHTKNSLGFRGPEPPRSLAGRLSIVTVGGSTTECLFLSDGRTWTDVLGAKLAHVVPNLWINNAGLDGHSTFGHRKLLEQVIVPLRPTMVLFLVGINDMGAARDNRYDRRLNPSASAWRRAAAFAAEHLETVALVQNSLRAARAHADGLGHSEIPITAWPRLALDREAVEQRVREYQPTLGQYRERLEGLVDVCRRAGIEPVLITQPALFGEAIDASTGVDLATLRVYERGSGALEWRLLEMTNDVTRQVATRLGVLLIDLAHELPKDSRLYYDLMHFDNEGAARVGDVIAAHLGPVLRSRVTTGAVAP